MQLSIVVPVYNEEESLVQLHKEICDVLTENSIEAEIIFVDDGSKDDSWNTVVKLSETDSRIKAIRFRRNFGKAAALNAGFSEATGDIIITMDADLQDDPKEIPEFLEMMNSKLDVISGWKKIRHDPWHKTIPSKFFNAAVSWVTGTKLHDHNCGMKCYRREVFDEVTLYGELHRFVPVLAAARGFKVGEKVIQHRERKFGHSKYGFERFIKGILDIMTVKFVTGFGQRPQHILGSIGLTSFLIGFVTLTYLAFWWTFSRIIPEMAHFQLHNRPAVIYSVGLLLLGAQLVSIGIIAELFIAYQHKKVEDFSIKDKIDNEKKIGKEEN
ncbi:MAG: glycosyltransferase family 2 protein [Thermoguttaceae bacterium]